MGAPSHGYRSAVRGLGFMRAPRPEMTPACKVIEKSRPVGLIPRLWPDRKDDTAANRPNTMATVPTTVIHWCCCQAGLVRQGWIGKGGWARQKRRSQKLGGGRKSPTLREQARKVGNISRTKGQRLPGEPSNRDRRGRYRRPCRCKKPDRRSVQDPSVPIRNPTRSRSD